MESVETSPTSTPGQPPAPGESIPEWARIAARPPSSNTVAIVGSAFAILSGLLLAVLVVAGLSAPSHLTSNAIAFGLAFLVYGMAIILFGVRGFGAPAGSLLANAILLAVLNAYILITVVERGRRASVVTLALLLTGVTAMVLLIIGHVQARRRDAARARTTRG